MNTAQSNTLKLSKAHDLTSFASNDRGRLVLGGVHYNADKHRVEATDGKILATLTVPDAKPETARSVIVPSQAFKKINTFLPGKKSTPMFNGIELVPEEGNRVGIALQNGCDKYSMSLQAVEGNYPNIESVMVRDRAPVVKIKVSGLLLKKIADYVARHSKDGSVTFQFFGSEEPIRFDADIDSANSEAHLEGVLMPMRGAL